jgi:hypothetical protein
VVGRAPAVLGRRRVVAFALLGAAVGSYYVWRTHLPDLSLWWDVALLCFPIMPAVWRENGWAVFGIFAITGLAAIGCELADFQLAANFAKLFCFATFGWWALRFFEELSWVVLIAVIVPLVDSFSVFSRHGPTHNITEHHPGTFFAVAVAFVLPKQSSAQVGPPDVVFFALFLAAADRFRLRLPATFAAMVLLLGAGIVLSVWQDINGIPALVPLSLGFLGANADLLWHRLRRAPLP